jgi:hypothetical protein
MRALICELCVLLVMGFSMVFIFSANTAPLGVAGGNRSACALSLFVFFLRQVRLCA